MILWLPEALEDIQRLYHFLTSKNPEAACRAMAAIREGSGLLVDSPNLGRPLGDDTRRRELVIAFASGAYVLRYMLDKNGAVVVVRVWHSREEKSQ